MARRAWAPLALAAGFALLPAAGRAQAAVDALAPGGHIARLRHVGMYYEVRGAGRPLVLLHGGASTIERSFGDQLDEFARDRLVIAPEQRGHGHTRDVPGPYRYSDMADDTAELLDHLGIRDAEVVGWSDGAVLGLMLVLRRPELVHRLAVAAPNAEPGRRAITPETLAMLRDYRAETDTAGQHEYTRLSGDSAGGYTAVIAKLKLLWLDHPTPDELSLAALGHVRVPTLVLAGDHDVIRLEHILAIQRAIPGAELCVVPNAGHAIFRERPALVSEVLRAFFEESPPR